MTTEEEFLRTLAPEAIRALARESLISITFTRGCFVTLHSKETRYFTYRIRKWRAGCLMSATYADSLEQAMAKSMAAYAKIGGKVC